MGGILTDREQGIVSETKEQLQGLEKLLEGGSQVREKLLPAYKEVLRELRGFDSELFIVSSMGMLKSGKSSLVNLLTRSELASPIGYGTDTTLRPALIMQATERSSEGEIEVWFDANPTELAESATDNDEAKQKIDVRRKEMLSSIFDFVRGVGDSPTTVSKKTYSLTPEKLQTILCKKRSLGNELPSEPILVIVYVPWVEGALVSDKIVILDTPGLDSMNSEWTKNSSWYLWLMEKSDLYLFLQSSVAPLNLRAGEILKELRSQKRGRPIWLIQNRMEAKHWQKEEVQRDENTSQMEKAITEFQKISTNTSSYSVNLGKAFPKVFEKESLLQDGVNPNQLLNDSGFSELEKDIKDSLRKNASRHRKENCIKNVESAKNKFINELEKFRQSEIDAIRGEHEQKKAEIETAAKTLTEKIDPNLTPPGLRMPGITNGQISFRENVFQFDSGNFEKSLSNAFEPNEKYVAKELNDFKSEIIKQARDRFRNQLERITSDDVDWTSNGNDERSAQKELRKKITGDFSDFIRKVMDETQREKELLKADSIQAGECPSEMGLSETYSVSEIEFPDYVMNTDFKWSNLLTDVVTFRVRKRRYSGKQLLDTIGISAPRVSASENNVKGGNTWVGMTLRETLKAFYDGERRKLQNKVSDWANNQFKSLCREFLKCLEKRKHECLREIDRKMERIDELEKNIREVKAVFNKAMEEFEKIKG